MVHVSTHKQQGSLNILSPVKWTDSFPALWMYCFFSMNEEDLYDEGI